MELSPDLFTVAYFPTHRTITDLSFSKCFVPVNVEYMLVRNIVYNLNNSALVIIYMYNYTIIWTTKPMYYASITEPPYQEVSDKSLAIWLYLVHLRDGGLNRRIVTWKSKYSIET